MDFDIIFRFFLRALPIVAFIISLPLLWPGWLGILIVNLIEKHYGSFDDLDTLEQSGVLIIFFGFFIANLFYAGWVLGG